MRLADMPQHSYGNPPWLRFYDRKKLRYYWERKPVHIVREILKRVSRNRVVRHEHIGRVIMMACKKYSGTPLRTYVAVMGRHYDDQPGIYNNWFKDGDDLRIGSAAFWDLLKMRANDDDATYCDVATRTVISPEYPFSELKVICEGCGKIARNKSQTGIAYRWMGEECLNGLFCVGCWNKRKPIGKKFKEVEEIRKLVNKLNKTRLETTKWQKSQQQAI